MADMVKTYTQNMCLILTICSGSLLMFEVFIPKTMAYKNDDLSKINEFLIEDQKTEPKEEQNYLLQHDMADLLEDLLSRAKKSNYERKFEELPGFIVDYKNMYRNDVILRDNSVETRTRKRGNIKVEKYDMPLNPPCTCEHRLNPPKDLGSNYFPRFVENIECVKHLCPEPYKCQATNYNQTVLKRKETLDKRDTAAPELSKGVSRWTTAIIPVITGCMCKRDYTNGK